MSVDRQDLVVGAVVSAASVLIIGFVAGASTVGVLVGAACSLLVASGGAILLARDASALPERVVAAPTLDAELRRPAQPRLQTAPLAAPRGEPSDADWDRTVERAQTTPASLPAAPAGVLAVKVSKQGNSPAECEDAYAVAQNCSVAAISDGASSSFGAGEWASLLVERFVSQPPPPMSASGMKTWLEAARDDARSGLGEGAASWWAEAGSEMGAFATLLGVVMEPSTQGALLRVMSVGDCCCFVVRDHSIHTSLPYEDGSQFGSHPALLGSSGGKETSPLWSEVEMIHGDSVVLASDAVAEWLLAERGRIAQVLTMTSARLEETLVSERSAGRIVNDDLTMVVLPPV